MRIRTQLILSMVSFAIAVLIISSSFIQTHQHAGQLNKQEELARKIEFEASELSYLSNEFLLSQNGQQQDLWKKKFSALSDHLSSLDVNRPDQRALLQSIKANQSRLGSTFDNLISEKESMPRSSSSVASSEIAVQTKGIVSEASLLAQMLHNQAEHRKGRNFYIISILIGAITAIILINYLFFYRGMIKSIADLEKGTKIIGSGNFDVSLVEKKGDEIGELSSAFNMMARELKGVTASKVDLEREIAYRKKAEENLRETRDYLESLIDNANAPIIVWDPAFRITRVNHSFERLTGMRANDVLGKRLDILFPEESLTVSLDHIERALSGEHWETVEIPILNADGSVRTALWNSANIYDKDGLKIVATIAQGQDITERKLVELDLKRARDTLEERVRERTADLSRATEELASRAQALSRKSDELMRSNAELEQFAHIASHDLQEPLRMISSYVQLLSRRYKGRLDEDADEFIAYAVEGTVRMQQLIDGLLAYSRIGTRGRPPAPISLEKALFEAMANLKMAIDESGARVTHDELPYVSADGTQMVQLFQNLIGNAIKFRSEEKPRIHILARQEQAEWIVSVQDNGIGIDPQFFERIFTIFQRLHGRDEYPGTGIGLTISRKIVERHGGRIWLESEPGKGTTFYFSIPLENQNWERGYENSG